MTRQAPPCSGDGQREQRHERPAECHLRRPAHDKTVLVKRHGAGEDRDDRERDGEVRESAYRAEQLLRIPERVELMRIREALLIGGWARVVHETGTVARASRIGRTDFSRAPQRQPGCLSFLLFKPPHSALHGTPGCRRRTS